MKKGNGKTQANRMPHAGTLWIALALVALNVFIYAPVWSYEFVSWDDPLYVRDNAEVSPGITWHGVVWAFTTGHAANWHPLTWLSHMLDVQLYGVAAGPHHVTNVLLHIANTLLLFGVLRRMTRATGASVFVTALFAVHPMHVESVAWISERKDVLSTLFWTLTLWAYVAYARQPRWGRYLSVIALFAFGLMAKPMLVTLPFLLLLLDIWPLRRVRLERGQRDIWLRLAREKLPLFALAILASVVTVVVQSRGGTVAGLEAYSWSLRAANAPVSYAAYIAKTVWPARLAPFYPYGTMPAWWVAGSTLALIGVCIVTIRAAARRPYLLVGWFWFLGALTPVIGLIQVGDQARADRYTYVPLVGVFIIAAWGIPDLLAKRVVSHGAYRAAAGVVVCVLALAARGQVRHWENSFVLWQHTVDVTAGNYLAHTNLGFALAGRGQDDEAMAHFKEAIRIKPDFAEAHNALGVALVKQGQVSEAMPHYLEALRIKPSYAEPHSNLGMVLAGQGRTGEAIIEFLEALRIDPSKAEIHYNLGFALADQGRVNEAIDQYNEALRLNPALAEVHSKMGDAFSLQGKFSEAVDQYNQALKIKPDLVEAHNNLAVALMNHGRDDEALAHFTEALRINPRFADAHNNLGIALANRGQYDEAIAHFREAIRLRPNYKQAQDNLEVALATKRGQ